MTINMINILKVFNISILCFFNAFLIRKYNFIFAILTPGLENFALAQHCFIKSIEAEQNVRIPSFIYICKMKAI